MGPCAIDPIPGTYASIARYSYFAILLSESGWERNKALADFNLRRLLIILTHTRTRGSASAFAAEPPGCSSLSLSLLGAAAAAALLLASERLRFGTRLDELAPPARARFFSCCCCCCCCWCCCFVFLGGLGRAWCSRARPGSP